MKQRISMTLSAIIVAVTVGLMSPAAHAQRSGGTTTFDPVARQALITALNGPEGEYAARAEYTAILAKFGTGVQPYANILEAEKKHVAALEQQCVKYGVPIPADPYLGKVTAPGTLLEAAEIGVVAETLTSPCMASCSPRCKSIRAWFKCLRTCARLHSTITFPLSKQQLPTAAHFHKCAAMPSVMA